MIKLLILRVCECPRRFCVPSRPLFLTICSLLPALWCLSDDKPVLTRAPLSEEQLSVYRGFLDKFAPLNLKKLSSSTIRFDSWKRNYAGQRPQAHWSGPNEQDFGNPALGSLWQEPQHSGALNSIRNISSLSGSMSWCAEIIALLV